jgi:hypothetical protein
MKPLLEPGEKPRRGGLWMSSGAPLEVLFSLSEDHPGVQSRQALCADSGVFLLQKGVQTILDTRQGTESVPLNHRRPSLGGGRPN